MSKESYKPWLGSQPILKPKEVKSVEVQKTSQALDEVHAAQKALMDKIREDKPVTKGEWQELARHARKAKKIAPQHEHPILDGIAVTAEAFIE